jgi:para-aminobenzoate synthetase component 1
MTRLSPHAQPRTIVERVPAPIPILRQQIDCDPRSLAARVAALSSPAILESGRGFPNNGRWSIYAAWPRSTFHARANADITVIEHEHTTNRRNSRQSNDPFAAFGAWLARFDLVAPKPAPPDERPPFLGGAIGWIAYDAGAWLDRVPRHSAVDNSRVLLAFDLYDTFVTHDLDRDEVAIWAVDLNSEGEHALRDRLDRWAETLNRPEPATVSCAHSQSVQATMPKSAYVHAVDQSLAYIRAGDVYQVNLAQRFEAFGPFIPLDVFLRLRDRSPAPFSAFIPRGRHSIVSSSPECFFQTRGRRIVTDPIKGTRPRGVSIAADQRLRTDLATSEKDRAELTMIIDLERNDLGRVCEFGTVRVSDPFRIESFSNVHHLVASVEGTLQSRVGPIEILRALFPGGSITGAPKIRAMQIITEIEPVARNAYTGSIGYLSLGASAFNIAIRTLEFDGEHVAYHVGGAIVADSNPESEYQETLDKGRAIREVLEGWTAP